LKGRPRGIQNEYVWNKKNRSGNKDRKMSARLKNERKRE
jgi:hypothetical protein